MRFIWLHLTLAPSLSPPAAIDDCKRGVLFNDDDDGDGNKNHQQQLFMIVKRVVLQKVQTEMVMDWDDDGEYFDSDDANNDNDADDDATRAA